MATIRDIARKAGVSPSTASRALNNNPRISEKTRKKVQKIASQENYQPDFTGRNLTLGESNMVGLIFPVTGETAPANPFHIDLMRGISVVLQKRHYEMVVAIAQSQEKLLDQVKSMVNQSKVHNFLLFYSKENDEVTKYLNDKKLNFVIIGASDKYRHVDNDNIAAGYDATQAFCQKKKLQKPAFVISHNRWTYEEDRLKGYQEYMKAQEKEPEIIIFDGKKADFEKLNQTDGLIFSDDLLYLRYLKNVKNKEFPVICFNSSRLISLVLGKTMHVDLQPRLLGERAVKVLFNNETSEIIPFKIG